jgi:hypothetical protein
MVVAPTTSTRQIGITAREIFFSAVAQFGRWTVATRRKQNVRSRNCRRHATGYRPYVLLYGAE